MYKAVFFLLIFIGLNNVLFSQYSISGVITDKTNNDPLPGASIRIKGTTIGTTSDLDGKYKLSVKQNNVTVIFSYVSYEPVEKTLSFENGRNIKINIKLLPTSTDLEQVEILGEATGQVKAMLDMKMAQNIKSVVSSEQIEQFPDINAAEAISRIPGVTLQRDQGEGRYVQLRGTPPAFTNFNVNGEQIPSPEGSVRYVGLDIVSADQIEFIEITKVLTPDMDADGIGGNVNIKTKTAKDTVAQINATLASGYNNLRETPNYLFQYSYAQRTGKFGFLVNGSYYESNQGADNIEFNYDRLPVWGSDFQELGEDNLFLLYEEMELRYYDVTRKRTALSSSMDYQFNSNHALYLKGMYNRFSDDEVRYRKTHSLDDALSLTRYRYGSVNHDVRDRLKVQELMTINLNGEHKFDFFKLDYGFVYSRATENEPDYMYVKFDDGAQAIITEINEDNPEWPVAEFPNEGDKEKATNFENFEFDELELESNQVEDENLTAKMDISVPFNIGRTSNNFKFGGKIRLKEKTRRGNVSVFENYYEELRAYYTQSPPEFNLGHIAGNFEENNLLGQGYTMSYMPDPENMRAFYNNYPHHFIYARKENIKRNYENEYDAMEEITAGYGMIEMNIDKFLVIAGLRYEKTYINYDGYYVNLDSNRLENMIEEQFDGRNHHFLLPNYQVKYTPFSNFNLRAALTYSFARPNFDEVVPFHEEDDGEISTGNVNLKYPFSTNFDFLSEYYFGRNGLISAGVFYKKIENFIFDYTINAYEGEDDGTTGNRRYLFEIPLNGIEAYVYGAELQAQFKFGEVVSTMSGFIKNFGIYTNYTYTHSKAEVYKRIPARDQFRTINLKEADFLDQVDTESTEAISLPGQTPHTANFALFYDDEKVHAKISANYHDAFLNSLGADSELDEYYAEALHIDFNADYAITDNIKIFCNVVNLTNAPLRFYLGEDGKKVKQKEYYSWWARAGFKLSF